MKKSIFFLGFTILTLASCKKDYTCECYLTGSSVVIESYQLKNLKEKEAISKCDSYDGTIDLLGQTVIKDCKIQ